MNGISLLEHDFLNFLHFWNSLVLHWLSGIKYCSKIILERTNLRNERDAAVFFHAYFKSHINFEYFN